MLPIARMGGSEESGAPNISSKVATGDGDEL
jgi:hypothetical protein